MSWKHNAINHPQHRADLERPQDKGRYFITWQVRQSKMTLSALHNRELSPAIRTTCEPCIVLVRAARNWFSFFVMVASGGPSLGQLANSIPAIMSLRAVDQNVSAYKGKGQAGKST